MPYSNTIHTQPENDPSIQEIQQGQKSEDEEKLEKWYQGRNGAGLGLICGARAQKNLSGETKRDDR